jgi:hypothetical protein
MKCAKIGQFPIQISKISEKCKFLIVDSEKIVNAPHSFPIEDEWQN